MFRSKKQELWQEKSSGISGENQAVYGRVRGGIMNRDVRQVYTDWQLRFEETVATNAPATFAQAYAQELAKYDELIATPNRKSAFYNGVWDRYCYPVMSRERVPLFWRYDLNPETNPYFMERLGINAVFNSGAIYFHNRFYLMLRVEGADRKSFFALAESESGTEGFRMQEFPVELPDMDPEETNVYDMRLTQHEDGYIYGIFCSESHDRTAATWDTEAAMAQAGIVRTKDLKAWERLPNLETQAPQQRNVVLHPEFVDGQYAFYTRPQNGFIESGTGAGICWGLCRDIRHPVIEKETLIYARQYHTIAESKNGQGTVPIKTPKGWLHIAHGVRRTAAGLRYVLYLFVTDLEHPDKVIAEPGGYVLAPIGSERVGDVSNVLFSNGAVALDNGEVYLYYASSDTRLHVATSTIERLLDYAWGTPPDPRRSADCVKQRKYLIQRNIDWLKSQGRLSEIR